MPFDTTFAPLSYKYSFVFLFFFVFISLGLISLPYRCCALFNTQRICRYRMKLGDENEWYHISSLCRNRVTYRIHIHTYIFIYLHQYWYKCVGHLFHVINGSISTDYCRLRHTDLPSLHPAGPSQILIARRLLGNHSTTQANDSGQIGASITTFQRFIILPNFNITLTLYIYIYIYMYVYLIDCAMLRVYFYHIASYPSRGD